RDSTKVVALRRWTDGAAGRLHIDPAAGVRRWGQAARTIRLEDVGVDGLAARRIVHLDGSSPSAQPNPKGEARGHQGDECKHRLLGRQRHPRASPPRGGWRWLVRFGDAEYMGRYLTSPPPVWRVRQDTGSWGEPWVGFVPSRSAWRSCSRWLDRHR